METKRDEKFLKEHGIKDWGNFNHHPTPCVETDMDDFWGSFSLYGLDDMEYRQVYLSDRRGTHSVHIIVYHDKIFMLEIQYYFNETPTYQPRVWRIGCIHDWSEVSTHRGDHWRTCRKCGYQYYYDSSG